MNRWLVSALALSLLGAGAMSRARADHIQPRAIEDSIETTADQVSMPASAGGLVSVHACSACDAQVMRLASSFVPRIGGRVVTLDQFNSALSSLGSSSVTVIYSITDKQVTRIVGQGL